MFHILTYIFHIDIKINYASHYANVSINTVSAILKIRITKKLLTSLTFAELTVIFIESVLLNPIN